MSKLIWWFTGAGVAGLLVCLGVILLIMRAWRRQNPIAPPQNIFQVGFSTGDLILANVTPWIPTCRFTRGQYDHTGIIYVHPETRQIFVWHVARKLSTFSITDFHPLHVYCRMVKGQKLTVRKVIGKSPVCAPPLEWFAHWQKKAMFYFDATGRNLSNALKHLPPGNLGDFFFQPSKKSSTFACVDMTTATYVKMGVLEPRALKMGLFVEDYCESLDLKRLPFTNGYSLGPEIIVSL